MSGVDVRLNPADPQESGEAREFWAHTDFQAREYHGKPTFYAQRLARLVEALKPDSVLEFGANAGRNLALIREGLGQGATLCGLDINAESVQFGIDRFELDLRVGDEHALEDMPAASWDVVFTVSVLDHLPDPVLALAELIRVSRKWVILLEPHHRGSGGKLESYRSDWDVGDEWQQATPYSYIHDYDELLADKGLEEALNIPVPTTLARMGPLYRLRLYAKSGVATPDLRAFVDETLRQAQLHALESGRERVEDRKRLHARVDQLRERVATLKARLDSTEEDLRRVNKRAKALEADVEYTLGTTSYRLGNAMVESVRQPLRLFTLPFRVAALGARGARRMWARSRTPQIDTRRSTNEDVFAGCFEVHLEEPKPLTAIHANRPLHLLEYSVPHQQNGYTLRARELIRAQKALGWDPVVVTKPGFPEPADAPREEEVDGIRTVRLPGRGLEPKPSLPAYLSTYVREAAQVVEDVQPFLIHAASNFRNAYAAWQLARNYGLPFVYEVRGFWEETRVANGGLKPTDSQYQRLVEVETHCMKAADAVVTLGEAMRNAIVERGIPAEKVFLVPNGVNLDAIDIREARRDLIQQWELSGKFVLGYFGSVTRLESLHIALQALAELRDVSPQVVLLIVGGGTELEALQHLADDLEISEAVRFVGRVPHAEIPDYYALVDAIVCTRGRDRVSELVTPLKPFEAMGYRKPLIFSDLPALREIIVHEERGLLFRPESPPAMAREIRRLAADPDLAARLAEHAFEWVSGERTWTAVAAAYRAAYEYAGAQASARTTA